MKIENVKTEKLIPYARNAKLHDDRQVAAIAGSIKDFGFNNPVLIDNDDGIIAGHGRVLAAKKLGLKDVPCIRLSHLTDTQRRAYILADNRLAEIGGGWDAEMLQLEIAELKELEIDIDGIGWTDVELTEIIAEHGNVEQDENIYTNKIIAPVYEPKGEKPHLSSLIDRSKTQQLVNQIDSSSLPDDIKEFMRYSAERHTVFNFRQIAEYYCHADPVLQDLMERSGMVIIDFKKAIEYGFVHMTEQLGKLADLEGGDDGDV